MFVVRITLFLIYVYSGLRSAFNLTRSVFFRNSGLRSMDRTTIFLDSDDSGTIRVHSRPLPKSVDKVSSAGMISVFLHSPGISQFSYAALRLTSHFGIGHIEIAFYEKDGTIVLFAVRNMLQANVDRLGLRHFFGGLKLSSREDEALVLQRIVDRLNCCGRACSFALPDHSVKLAVIPYLLDPKKRDRIKRSIRSNYKWLVKRIDCNV
ncbi:hypothetical protein N8639_01715 [bacterium]|jgi:hypothetical protein|nr:hypothetical protein [bacterium]